MSSAAAPACLRRAATLCLRSLPTPRNRPLSTAFTAFRSHPLLPTHRSRSSPLTSPLSSPSSSSSLSLHRAYSTLPVISHYVPRRYPFPLVLTTEMLTEEDLEQQPLHPHDLPPYKSTLTVNLHDLPLTAGEKRIFRHLVGPRMFSTTFRNHPIPAFLHAKRVAWKGGGKGKGVGSAVVRFVSRHLPSAEANENRVFQLLDECVRMSKVLAMEMEGDGEWVEMGEDEEVMREARLTLRKELWEERQKKRGHAVGEGEHSQAPQLSADSAAQQRDELKEKVRVDRAVQGDQ